MAAPASWVYGRGRDLFKRRWRITIDTLRFSELDVMFRIEKSLKDEPNKCELSIWNLQENHRAAIEALQPVTKTVSATLTKKQKVAARKQATKGIPVMIEAGYGETADNMSLLWLGDLRTAYAMREGPDWVTKLESGDGEKAYQNARVNVSFGPKTPVSTVMRAIVRSLGLGQGNLDTIVHRLEITGVGKLFPQGTVVSGPAASQLRELARAADLEVSIQDGTLQFLPRGDALQQPAIRVAADTGMLDSPTVDVDGILTVKMLLVPDIRPGRLIKMDALRIKGNYRIDKCAYICDSAGDEWGVEIQASKYKGEAT